MNYLVLNNRDVLEMKTVTTTRAKACPRKADNCACKFRAYGVIS